MFCAKVQYFMQMRLTLYYKKTINSLCYIEQKNVTRNGTVKSTRKPWNIDTTA
jgi:hypothetical protein